MAKQESAVSEGPDTELVWAQSPATSRKKQMHRGKLRILAGAKWKECGEPKEDDPLIVAPFPSVAPGDVADAPADQPEQNTRSGRAAAAQKEGS